MFEDLIKEKKKQIEEQMDSNVYLYCTMCGYTMKAMVNICPICGAAMIGAPE